MTGYSEARNKATQKYVKNNCDRLYITIAKGKKEELKAAAEAAGESLTAYLMHAAEMRIAQEKSES